MTGVQRVLEAGLLVSGALAIFIFLSLVSFNPADPSWSQTGYEGSIHNAGGAVGAWVSDVLLFAFGFVAYLIPFGFAGLGYLLFRKTYHLLEMDYLAVSLRMIGALLALIGASALSSINFDDIYYFSAGGVIGDVIAASLLPYLNFVGSTLLLLTFFFTGITLVTGISWLQVADKLGEWAIVGVLWLVDRVKQTWQKRDSNDDEGEPEENSTEALTDNEDKETKSLTSDLFGADKQEPVLSLPSISAVDEEEPVEEEKAPRFSKEAAERKRQAKAAKQDDKSDEPEVAESDVDPEVLPPLPSIELLDRPNKKENPITQDELDQVSRTVETVLKDFGVDVRVAHVQPGPVITRFELDLAPGVKVSKISNLAKDIARTLSAVAVRVVEVIPGKSYVGLELPNKHREIVQLSEVINSDQFGNSQSPLTMILGKDIAGKGTCRVRLNKGKGCSDV